MIIELYRAWTPEDVHEDKCGLCGHTIAPTSVIADAAADDRYGMGYACPSCVEYLGKRNPAKSPTIEFYREMLEKYPEPMYASDEELRAAAEEWEDPSDIASEAAWLWQAPREDDDIHVVPTIIHRGDLERGTHAAAVVETPEKGRALIVFRSEEEVEKYRAGTGNHPEAEDWRTATLDLEELGHVLEAHDCTYVAMPEPWTGEGAVDFFEASDFIRMLRESVPA